jgi:tripartite-type tricarboxylate transporter receptor subunit TctC
VKKDGRWRIVADSPEMSGESEKNFAQFMAAFEASRDMMKAVTENLNAGKYADEKAMVADLSERMKAMQEKMKGLMGGPK